MFHPADCTYGPSISEKPISRKTERIRSINACIGCGLPPKGTGAGALTSNGLNLASLHESPCSISGVTSPTSSTSSSPDSSSDEPASVRLQLRETCSSVAIRPLRPEKWLTISASREAASRGPSARLWMKDVLCSMPATTAPSSAVAKAPASTLIPRALSKPTPGPASWRSNAADRPAMVLSVGFCSDIQSQRRASNSPSATALAPSSPRDTIRPRSSATSTSPASASPAPAPATWT